MKMMEEPEYFYTMKIIDQWDSIANQRDFLTLEEAEETKEEVLKLYADYNMSVKIFKNMRPMEIETRRIIQKGRTKMGTKVKLSETFGKRIAIHCPKAEQRKALLEAYEKSGITWGSGKKATEWGDESNVSLWENICESNPCLFANENPPKIWVGPYSWFKSVRYEIVEFDEVDLAK